MDQCYSRGREIADVLDLGCNQWWFCDELMEKIVPGFQKLSARSQVKEITNLLTRVHEARAILKSRGKSLLRKGRGQDSKFKVATKKDKEEVIEQDTEHIKEVEQHAQRVCDDIKNQREQGILPPGRFLSCIIKK